MKMKSRASSLVSSQKIVAGEHLNPNGVLFGGYLMSWVDEIAFICARRYTGKPGCVTVNIDNITFKTPIRLGEHVHLSAQVNAVGRSSMEIEVIVEKENPHSQDRTRTNTAHLTFVCLGKNFRPISVPRLALETIEDHRKGQESRLRNRVRRRLGAFLERKIVEDWPLPQPRRRANRPQHISLLKKWLSPRVSASEEI